MLNRKIFKAYDIRGIYPTEINETAVFQIASDLSSYFKKKIIIGHDARLSSKSLYKELKKGLAQNKKLKWHDAGLITTPTMYFLVNHFNLDGGVMITASHDPKEFNGMKIVGPKAQMISGTEIKELIGIKELGIGN